MKSQQKIVEILALLSTDKREEAIRAYIEYSVKKADIVNSASEIVDNTKNTFGLVLQVDEVNAEIQWLRANGRISCTNGPLQLTEVANIEVAQSITAHEKQKAEQYQIFQREIQNTNKGKIAETELSALFTVFEEYLYDCFLEYGRAATSIFNPNIQDEEKSTKANVFLQKALTKVRKAELRKVLEEYIVGFNKNITVKQAEYLESLASKSESFFALGLPQELHSEFQRIAPLNWTILLDTNVLYSILKLHSNTENEAIRAIVEINNRFKDIFSIKFKYLPLTYKELKLLKSELEGEVLKINLNEKQIAAALASGKLDGYTKSYYENILENGVDTLHPTSIIDKAVTSLKAKGIELYNREIFKEGEETEEFKDKISAFNTYQQIRNEARVERGLEYRVPKSMDKIVHDVTLREMVLLLRHDNSYNLPTNASECKTYGLTIDKTLMDFDRYELGKPSNTISGFIPTFFFPSYLLKRMYRYLPLQSDDYRKSFLSSISSPILNLNSRDSNTVQRALAYFRALGIDDTDFMIASLTSDIFLQNVNRFGDDTEKLDEFVESEINKTIKEKNDEIRRNTRKINTVQNKLKASSQHSNQVSEKNESLESHNETLEQHVKALTTSLGKVHTELKKSRKQRQVQPVQVPIPFADEKDLKINQLQVKVEKLAAVNDTFVQEQQKSLASRQFAYRREAARRWQKAPLKRLWILLGAVSFILIGVTLWMFSTNDWMTTQVSNKILGWFENKIIAWIAGGIVTILTFIAGGVFIKEYLSRREPKNYDVYLNQVPLDNFE